MISISIIDFLIRFQVLLVRINCDIRYRSNGKMENDISGFEFYYVLMMIFSKYLGFICDDEMMTE